MLRFLAPFFVEFIKFNYIIRLITKIKGGVSMKILFSFFSVSSKGKYNVAVEVVCQKKPQIKVGDLFVGLYPIESFSVIENQSSKNWKDRFLVGSSPANGVSVYGGHPEDSFGMDYPTIVEE